MEPDNPARPWQELAEKTAHEQDPKKVVELAKELIRAFDEQQTSRPRKSNPPKRDAYC